MKTDHENLSPMKIPSFHFEWFELSLSKEIIRVLCEQRIVYWA